MAYQMHRVFCATPAGLEAEHGAFYEVMGEFNAAQAMPRGILLVSVSVVPAVFDKRPFQPAIEENIRACRFYLQVVESTWGTPERNFEADFKLALACAADPSALMQDVVVLFKRLAPESQLDPALAQFKASLAGAAEYSDLQDYKQRLWAALASWLNMVSPAAASA